MAIKDLIDYMNEYSEQGYSIEELEKHLIEQGYNKAQVAQAAHTVSSNKQKSHSSLHPVFIGVAALFFLSVAALLFFLVNTPEVAEPQTTVIRFNDTSITEIVQNNQSVNPSAQEFTEQPINSTTEQPTISSINQTLQECGDSQFLNTTLTLRNRLNDSSVVCFGEAIKDCAYATILLLPDTLVTTQNCLVENKEVLFSSQAPKDIFVQVISQLQNSTNSSVQ